MSVRDEAPGPMSEVSIVPDQPLQTDKKQRPMPAGRRFQPGKSGNPKGRPKLHDEFKQATQRFLESAEYRESLKVRVLEGKAPHMELYLHHYVYGKPADRVDIGQPKPFVVLHRAVPVGQDPLALEGEVGVGE